MTLRPIAINDLPYPSQVRFEAPGYSHTVSTDSTGRVGFPDVPTSIIKANLFIASLEDINVGIPGYQWYGEVVDVPASPVNDWWATEISPLYSRPLPATWHQLPHLLIPTGPPHIDPSTIPLETLAIIRGAMWPTGLSLPFGSRPGQPDNIIATDFMNNYSPEDQIRVLQWEKDNGYTHVVVGPIVDSDGYHGKFTPNDWRGKFDSFLDILQTFWDNGQAPIVFIHPDGWTLEQTQELTPLFTSERAQRLMRIIVPGGWEPTRYDWSSWTWAAFGAWARHTWPNALVLLHTVADVDAPVGEDLRGNDTGHPNAEGWARVAPHYHGWLVQNNAFEKPEEIAPNGKTNFQNWKDQFNINVRGSLMQRFHQGYAGWPTFSAWGPNQPLKVYAGEYAAYSVFWNNRPYSEAVHWGNAAAVAGADGYLDGGSL